MLTERRNQLLLHLMSADCLTTVQALAKKFHVSSRTIRYDLDALDLFLDACSLPRLIRKQHGGVKLPESDELHQQLLILLKHAGVYQYNFSAPEREIILIGQLMHSRDYLTIDDLANRLLVSRNTVIKDLNGVKTWYSRYGLELRSMPKYGLKVLGDERSLRQAAVQFIKDHVGLEKALEIVHRLIESGHNGPSMYGCCSEWFHNINFEIIQTSIRIIEKELQTIFSDHAFTNLSFYMAIALKRIQLGREVIMPAEELEVLQRTRAFQVMVDVAKQLGQSFHLILTLDEVGYLTEHILGSSVMSSAARDENSRMELDMLVCNLIANVSRTLKQDLIADRQLFLGLLDELRPCMYRLQYGLKLEHGPVEELKRNYEALFAIVHRHIKPIEHYGGGQLTDDEITHLTLHFGAALERVKPPGRSLPNILIVCANGLGTASLLASKLQSLFEVSIIGIAARHQANGILLEHQVDLVVSTVSLPDIAVPVVTVSPLLPPQDVAALRGYIEMNKASKSLLGRTLEIIEQHCQIDHYEQLYNDLAKHFDEDIPLFSAHTRQLPLRDLLTSDVILLDALASDWQEAIRLAGQVLVRQGSVEDCYIDAMIAVVQEQGPYIVLWPGIALPHAGIDKGVRKVGMSLVRLKNPVSFGHNEHDPVTLIVALAAVDHSSHVMALLDLTRMLGDPEMVERLNRLPDSRQVEALIANYSARN